MDPAHLLFASLIGLGAGIIGGLAGIGGSMVMLPGLAFTFGYHDRAHSEHHVYMAAAMGVNVVVAVFATRTHRKAGAVRTELVKRVMPAMIAAIIAGVLLSNLLAGRALSLGLAGFIAAYCILNLYRIVRPRPTDMALVERTSAPTLASIGAVSGFVGGLLGLGGGVVMVPLLQVVARIRLRAAIATSSAAMVASAAIGAIIKLATLRATHNHSPTEALLLFAAMSPGAVIGGTAGAALAHRLPLAWVRAIVSIVLLVAAVRLAKP
ncbi:MAG: sulfite exporter TauE/SafE family protein [Phycisphaerales bacterium]